MKERKKSVAAAAVAVLVSWFSYRISHERFDKGEIRIIGTFIKILRSRYMQVKGTFQLDSFILLHE
jgi:hypothetical protein